MRNFDLEKFIVISGPCVIESESHAMQCAEFLVDLFDREAVQFIFKASYDKANRSSINSFRGPGIREGARILEKIRREFNVPVLTDVHTVEEAREAASVCDVIQIPAFLCRQTDLIIEAARTGVTINVKKGQFMAPWDMKQVVDKIRSTGNESITLTERGASFGYNNLISDMRSIPIMKKLGYPVFFDATHSVQLPGGLGETSGGEREFIAPLSKAAVAAGCDGIFAESHPDPKAAKSDSSSVIPFSELPDLVRSWKNIYSVVNI